MQSEYIFKYHDAQDKRHDYLKFVQMAAGGFAIFMIPGGQHIELDRNRVSLNEQGIELLKRSPEAISQILAGDVRPWSDVVEFHKHYGIDYSGPPRELEASLQKFREDFIDEEHREFHEARKLDDPVERDAKQCDACVDLIYVLLGYMRLRGWSFPEAWRRVQAANMQKQLAKKQDPKRHGMDVIKPVGWTPPVLTDLVVIPKEVAK